MGKFGAQYRKFDGKTLYYYGFYYLKGEAKEKAAKRRRMDRKTRVVKVKSGYIVYSEN